MEELTTFRLSLISSAKQSVHPLPCIPAVPAKRRLPSRAGAATRGRSLTVHKSFLFCRFQAGRPLLISIFCFMFSLQVLKFYESVPVQSAIAILIITVSPCDFLSATPSRFSIWVSSLPLSLSLPLLLTHSHSLTHSLSLSLSLSLTTNSPLAARQPAYHRAA